jgi:hypothetical protein
MGGKERPRPGRRRVRFRQPYPSRAPIQGWSWRLRVRAPEPWQASSRQTGGYFHKVGPV